MSYTFNCSNHIKTQNIASCETDTAIIYFDLEYNYDFQEHCYHVYDTLGDAAEIFTFSTNDIRGESQHNAYTEAVLFYNSLVPEIDTIPLF